jgi:hypothetical protein
VWLTAFYPRSDQNTFYRFVVVSLSWQVADNSVAENVGIVTANLVLNGDIEKNIAVR